MDYQKDLEAGRRRVVGVNAHVMDEVKAKGLLKIDDRVEKMQIARIEETKRSRDNARVGQCLDAIRDAARAGDNLLYPIIDAVREYALLGEVCGTLVDVFGAYEDPAVF